jgi:luciferase family oxidoreductase group 1
LSVLDLSVVNDGQSTTDTLGSTARVAQRADELGYLRYWVAEHHNMPSVACTAPTVLMAHLAAITERIHVGSGGVMLPNHAPLVVAEQFAMLEALHPGRVDVGVGRAPGTDQATAAAVRRSVELLGADDFPRDLLDLMGLLGDRRVDTGLWDRFRATPAAVSFPTVFLLG